MAGSHAVPKTGSRKALERLVTRVNELRHSGRVQVQRILDSLNPIEADGGQRRTPRRRRFTEEHANHAGSYS
jgi:hypothetical protein